MWMQCLRLIMRLKALMRILLVSGTSKLRDIHTDKMLDESPRAYKDIFEVMALQEELVDVIDHVRPFLNIKG
jgi:RNA-splicing ligase RtcB